jgi:hypothetical protein
VNRTLARFLLPFVLALVPASAGISSGAAPKPLALTAAPARLLLSGSADATVRIRNPGTKRLVVDVAPAGFALDLRGRPRIVARRGVRSAAEWLTLRPTHFTLAPHAAAHLRVSVRMPRHAEPGDHDALVLFSARPLANAAVSVRLRLGVVVIVRAPGAVVRRLQLGRLRVTRRGGKRALELAVVNAGNVTERLLRVRTVVSRLPSRRRIATAAAGARELRPRTRGLLDFRLRTRAHGPAEARVLVPAAPGRPALRRAYRIRL